MTPVKRTCGDVASVTRHSVKEYSYRCTFALNLPTNHFIAVTALQFSKKPANCVIMLSLISMKSHLSAASVEDPSLVLRLLIITFEHIPERSHLSAGSAIRHLRNLHSWVDISRTQKNVFQAQVHRRNTTEALAYLFFPIHHNVFVVSAWYDVVVTSRFPLLIDSTAQHYRVLQQCITMKYSDDGAATPHFTAKAQHISYSHWINMKNACKHIHFLNEVLLSTLGFIKMKTLDSEYWILIHGAFLNNLLLRMRTR